MISEDRADEAAARAGKYIAAVADKLDAIAHRASEVLAEAGAYEGVLNTLGRWAVDNSPVPPSELFEELIDTRGGFYAFAANGALDFMEGKILPPDHEPWPIEFASAHLVLDVYLFGNRVLELRRRLAIDRVLDAVAVAELVWIALRIGAMSNAFHPSIQTMRDNLAKARSELKADRDTRREGASTTNDGKFKRIDRERAHVLKLLPDALKGSPPNNMKKWTLTRLAEEISGAWKAGDSQPSVRNIRGYLNAAKAGGLEILSKVK